jgi:hypothetical protein
MKRNVSPKPVGGGGGVHQVACDFVAEILKPAVMFISTKKNIKIA